MRPRINNRNVNYLIRQEFGFKSSGQLFEKTEHHPILREKIVRKVVQEFTSYHFKEGRLTTLNPYTNKFETLNITDFKHVTSKEELLKELSTLHRTRMKMLEQSRKKLISLSKKKDRDRDLEATISPTEEKRIPSKNRNSRSQDLQQDTYPQNERMEQLQKGQEQHSNDKDMGLEH